ncbi:MAG: hypothetical protein FWG88_10965 [Oscillospiraceae bacterium]|nr:hypothetical protein [Oscillospiraceae bacterium]
MSLITVDENGSPIYSSSYNSNSYARGLLDAAEVAYNDPVGRHPNWEYPVPNQYFVD